jgi:hypothetical protein
MTHPGGATASLAPDGLAPAGRSRLPWLSGGLVLLVLVVVTVVGRDGATTDTPLDPGNPAPHRGSSGWISRISSQGMMPPCPSGS